MTSTDCRVGGRVARRERKVWQPAWAAAADAMRIYRNAYTSPVLSETANMKWNMSGMEALCGTLAQSSRGNRGGNEE